MNTLETAPSRYDTDQTVLLARFLREGIQHVVDLGAGLGRHAGYMLERGLRVCAVDHVFTPELQSIAAGFAERCRLLAGDVTRLPLASNSVEAIWSSHCLEHTLDPISVLVEWRRVLRPDGVLCVIVPPFKTQVVGRHVFTGWTPGQLMLTLLRAGFDIRDGAYARHRYNVCAIVRPMRRPVAFAPNDEILCRYAHMFPPPIEAEIMDNRRKNTFGETISFFEGDFDKLNWEKD